MRKTTEAGIDVSKDVLDAAACRDAARCETARFANDAAGHKKLVSWLTKGRRTVRVVLESTGTYSLDVALALHRARGVTVMVANPRAIKQFTGALMQRSKTDVTAAVALREFASRMPLIAWEPPAAPVLALRDVARRIAALVVDCTRERNRLHALRATATASTVVADDIDGNVRQLVHRIALLRAHAVRLIGEHAELQAAFTLLISIPGIAEHSAMQLLPELLVLPRGMTARQWVAHAGLDPRLHQSGTSVHRAARISKVGNAHVRRVLYMPALVAVQHDAHVRAFFMKLVARGKTPLQAYVAVMRKLLHAIYGILATQTPFAGERFHAAA